IYARRQGITLAVAAVFGVTTLLFVALSVFLALTYVMAPLWAALLCAATSAAVVAAEEGHEQEMTMARMKAVTAFAASVLPALAIGAVAFLLGRRKG
ncbi:MAG TPA: hypothetical protein VMM55_01460, partial [Thermohalobaculum sp.]|nr:hypothetical protein [Thermohalobaculum sp.]